MTQDKLAKLQALMDRSVRTATPSVADSVAFPERQMKAAELVEFVKQCRMIAMATVGPAGQPIVGRGKSEREDAFGIEMILAIALSAPRLCKAEVQGNSVAGADPVFDAVEDAASAFVLIESEPHEIVQIAGWL